jgi:hypothetical protein
MKKIESIVLIYFLNKCKNINIVKQKYKKD